jgi:hypothetical protein
MPGTALDHPLVRQYLRDLDAALKVLPTESARELREQLTAHLDEVLRPGADDEAVAQTLHRLGLPWSLAAEAAAASGRRPWIARLGWRGWTLIAAAVVAIGAITGYVAVVASTGPLAASGLERWWYPQDNNREVFTYANGQTQSTVPIRPGQRQGFVVQLVNFTSQTQTVLGPAGAFIAPNGGADVQLGVSTVDPDYVGGAWRSLRYTLPVSIPPNQTRDLRMLWTSTGCLQQEQQAGITTVALRVRVAWMTRTEVLQLPEGFFLGPAKQPCA